MYTCKTPSFSWKKEEEERRIPALTMHWSRMCNLKHVDKGRERGQWLEWEWNSQPKRVTAFPLCSMRSQLWQMQDRLGAAVLLPVLQLPTLARRVLQGWAEGHCCWVLLVFVLWGWAQRALRSSSAPAFLAYDERDVAEGVKRSGHGDKTQHAAGPTLAGPVAPLIRPSDLQISDVHFFRFPVEIRYILFWICRMKTFGGPVGSEG